jgi:uncharacterized protein
MMIKTMRMHRQIHRLSASAVLGALLVACGTQQAPRFHSLMPTLASVPAAPRAAGTAWQLLPVVIPAQVDQPQFVVRRADDTFAVLEQERWVAPLGDEIRGALAEHMAGTLGVPGATPAAGRKDWRVAVEVQRFDSTPGRSTLVAQWTVQVVQAGGDAPALRCRTLFQQSVGADIPALAGGHRQGVQRLGAAIATAVAALDAGRAGDCPESTP